MGVDVGIDGSVTPKSLQAAIGLFHMGRSATPTEEIQMMEQHGIFAPAEAAPLETAPIYVPSAGEVDQWLTAPTAVAAVMDAVAASMLPSPTAGVRDEESSAAAAAAAPPAAAPPAAAAAHAGVPPNMEGGVFIDKSGKRFTESQQKVSIEVWATKAVTGGWLHPRGNAMKRFKALWSENGRGSFNVKQLHYSDAKGIERYPSARGYCDGSELKGFPLFVPTCVVKIGKKRVIKDMRFYPLVADELEEGGAKRSAAEIGGGGKRQCVASVQKV